MTNYTKMLMLHSGVIHQVGGRHMALENCLRGLVEANHTLEGRDEALALLEAAAFDDRDTSTPRTGNALASVEEITFRRNRELGGVKLDIVVTSLVDGDRVSRRVPTATVDAAWPGTSKTLKNHLPAVIDAAV